MTDIDHTLLDVIRLALAGDTQSVRLYARKLLRRPPLGVANPGAFQTALNQLISEKGGARALRSAPAVSPPRSGHRTTRGSVGEGPIEPDSRMGLIQVEHDFEAVAPVFSDEVRALVKSLLDERARASVLQANGMEPTRKVLLTGPPGVGKTMTARYVAQQLHLPLVTISLAAVVSSYLGKTGQNLRQALDYAKSFPCVLLLDEFDALAKRRDDSTDVGELKRIVNVLLVELDAWPAHGFLIAATNHPDLLDPAVWRRFDRAIDLQLPTFEARREMILQELDRTTVGATVGAVTLLALATHGSSGSDTTRLTHQAIRAHLLGADKSIDNSLIEAASEQISARSLGDDERADICIVGYRDAKLTQRQLAQLLGVSHPTIGRILKGTGSRDVSHRGEDEPRQ